MNNAIKFTDEELKQIKSLQTEYQQKILKFGELNLRRFEIENEISKLKTEEDSLKNDYLSLQGKEEELVDSLVKKYGEGQLSLSTGEFIPSK